MPAAGRPLRHAGGGLCPGLNDVVQNIVYTLVGHRLHLVAVSGTGRDGPCLPSRFGKELNLHHLLDQNM